MKTLQEFRSRRGSKLEETEDRIAVWQSPLALIFVAAGVLLLRAVGWLGWQRYEDRVGGPPVQVVLADFAGSTGDADLDRALLSALRVDLSQSPFVSVLSITAVRTTLTQMMHEPEDIVTADMARDICEQPGGAARYARTLGRTLSIDGRGHQLRGRHHVGLSCGGGIEA